MGILLKTCYNNWKKFFKVGRQRVRPIRQYGTNSDSNVPVMGNGSPLTNTPGQTVNLTNVTAIAGGWGHSLTLKNDGTVWTWGYNESGQLGNGTNDDSIVPVQVLGLTGITAIAEGWGHSLSLKDDGTVWTWGHNESGQLGNGTDSDSNVPVRVSVLRLRKVKKGAI